MPQAVSSDLPGTPEALCARVAAPSVCFAAACILLAAAPTATPCFRHWRRSSLLPPLGELAAKQTERAIKGYTSSLKSKKKADIPEICLRRLQTGPKCGKMIHGYLMTTT